MQWLFLILFCMSTTAFSQIVVRVAGIDPSGKTHFIAVDANGKLSGSSAPALPDNTYYPIVRIAGVDSNGNINVARTDASGILQTAGGLAPILSGATADYRFLDGAGTVLTDSSGNGNHGTLGSGGNAPVWLSNGLSFTAVGQNVALPSAVNGTKTFFIAAYINPLTASNNYITYNYPMLIGASNGTSGLNLLIEKLNAGGVSSFDGVLMPSIFSSGGLTGSTTLVSGFHVIAYVLGTGAGNVDHIYIDGIETAGYGSQQASANSQNTGNLFLGASNSGAFAGGGFLGAMYRVVAYPSQLTSTQVNTVSQQIAGEAYSRGVQTTPLPIQQVTPILHCIGDSITGGTGAATPFCSQLSLTNQSYAIVNWAIGGARIQAVSGSEPNRVAPLCTSSQGPSNAIVFMGTNDLSDASSTAAGVMSYLAFEIQTLKNAGCRVFVGTMISRINLDAKKDSYDALILSQARTLGADGVMDFAANPLLGADGASANATYFNTDQVHPTTTGQGLLATAASNTLNYYYGSTIANPTVVTATTYQMLSGDGAVTASPTAAAAYTLPDCVGPSGATYTISNPQSAFALTIIGKSGQPINGLTTAITIASNSTVAVRDVPNPKNVSGCHWVM